ncbi:MAG: hypothetical protein WA984_19650 [Phormidesmis sp.]
MTLTTFATSQEAQQAAALMEGYRFDVGYHDAPQWVGLWLERYRPLWIRDAVVEALYQGRYKAFSVRQILELWQKRGQPIRHTTYEFEAAVCREYGGAKLVAIAQLPQDPTNLKSARQKSAKQKTDSAPDQQAKQSASRRIHRSLSSVSFNLSESKAQLIETAETLQAQPQDNPPRSPTRAIQPFKPALPFSAQTLRLTKQKALATLKPS